MYEKSLLLQVIDAVGPTVNLDGYCHRKARVVGEKLVQELDLTRHQLTLLHTDRPDHSVPCVLDLETGERVIVNVGQPPDEQTTDRFICLDPGMEHHIFFNEAVTQVESIPLHTVEDVKGASGDYSDCIHHGNPYFPDL